MAWYYGTYSCGCEGRTNVIGPTKNRQWIADGRFEKMCPECYAKYLEEQRAKENAEAAEKAAEMELPELQGTEKQVAWANTLRQNIIDIFEEVEQGKYERMARLSGIKVKFEELPLVLNYILRTYNSAKYYIDNRGRSIYTILEQESKEALKPVEEKLQEEAEAKTEAELRAEATVYPKNKITEAVAEIITAEDKIVARFEKNEKFIETVKSLGYKWGGRTWTKEIKETTGSYKDRAAELGNKLLNEGFPVLIMDHEIREKAIAGDFEPECDRWIYARKDTNSLAIRWSERNDRLYKTARSLPGSKWDGAVVVKVEHYAEVQEFANLYGFRFTQAAQKLMQEHIEATKIIPVVAPAKVEDIKEKDGLKEILKSSTDIIDDLKD